jgi:hypothetical protein
MLIHALEFVAQLWQRKLDPMNLSSLSDPYKHQQAPFALFTLVLVASSVIAGLPSPALADIEPPPSQEVPEEILRNELIFEARSPIDGSPMTAADYALLQAQLQTPNSSPQVNPDLRYLIFLLELRGVIKPILPFIP